MAIKPLVLLLSLLIVGCSSSDDNDGQVLDDASFAPGETVTETPDQPSNVETDSPDLVGDSEPAQFSEPDPAGESAVAQLSVPVVLDLSRELVTGGYLEQYFNIDASVGQLLVDGIGGQEAFQEGQITENEVQAPFACPEGGSVSVSYSDRNGPFGIFTGVFATCTLEGRTLSGTLSRNQNSGVTGGGDFSDVAINFDALSISDDTDGILSLSGAVSRNRSTSTAEMLADGERGSCALAESNINLSETSNIQSARLEPRNTAGTVIVSEAFYARSVSRVYDATSDQATCPLSGATRENGDAKLAFEIYGSTSLSGFGNITTSVVSDVIADASIQNATQETLLPGNSSVTVTASSNTDCTVQVDVDAAGAAISFIDDFCFVSKDF